MGLTYSNPINDSNLTTEDVLREYAYDDIIGTILEFTKNTEIINPNLPQEILLQCPEFCDYVINTSSTTKIIYAPYAPNIKFKYNRHEYESISTRKIVFIIQEDIDQDTLSIITKSKRNRTIRRRLKKIKYEEFINNVFKMRNAFGYRPNPALYRLRRGY